MTDNDNKRKLYDALSEDYDMGTFEQFSTDVEDEGKRKKLYDAIKGDYDMPDFDEFSQQLVGVRQETKPVATTPQKGGSSESSSVYQAPTSRTASYNYGGSVPESVYAQKNQAKNQEQRPQQTQQEKPQKDAPLGPERFAKEMQMEDVLRTRQKDFSQRLDNIRKGNQLFSSGKPKDVLEPARKAREAEERQKEMEKSIEIATMGIRQNKSSVDGTWYAALSRAKEQWRFGRPISNEAARLRETDIDKLMDEAWERTDSNLKEQSINKVSRMLVEGYGIPRNEARQMAENIVRGEVDKMMYERAVEGEMPRNVLEHILNRVNGNTIGTLLEGWSRAKAGTIGDMQAREEASQLYGKTHRVADIAGGVGAVGLDVATLIAGGFGGGAAKGVMSVGGAAGRKFATTMAGKAVQGMSAGAANLAAFEAIGEGANQLKYGGELKIDEDTGRYVVDNYNVGNILSSAGRGALLGIGTGVTGTLVGNVFDKAYAGVSSTAGKIGVRSGKTLTSIVADGTVFALPEFINGDGDWDTWLESVEMMAGFKVSGAVKSARSTYERLKKNPESRAGFETRLRAMLDGEPSLALTKDEKEELKRNGYADLSSLVEGYKRTSVSQREEIEKKHPVSLEPNENGEVPYNRFIELMEDNSISEAARAKMHYYVTGHRLPQSTVISSTLTELTDGNGNVTGYSVEALGVGGKVIVSRIYKSLQEAETSHGMYTRQAELNGLKLAEGVYDQVHEKMEDGLKADVVRKEVDSEYGVSIDKAIGKEPNRRSNEENRAIEEYIRRLAGIEKKDVTLPPDKQLSNGTQERDTQNDGKSDFRSDTPKNQSEEVGWGDGNTSSVEGGYNGEGVRDAVSDNQTQSRGGGVGAGSIEERLAAGRPSYNGRGTYEEQNAYGLQTIERAKELGVYIAPEALDGYGERYRQGTGESVVYLDKDTGRVVKVKDPFAKAPMKGNATSDALYEHLVHNLLFPESEYRLLGVTEVNGEMRLVLEQDYVDGGGMSATKEEVERYLTDVLGLQKEGTYWYGNELVSVTDVDAESDNVIVDSEGRLHFIDPIIKLKTSAKEVLSAMRGDNGNEAYQRGYDAAEQERRDITMRVAMGDETDESKAQYEGMRQRIEDDADTMAAGLREQNAKMSHSDGSLHPVLLKELDADGNGIEAYIVDGNVAMDSEGGVDASNSDRSIVIYDTKSGERRMIDPAGELGISSVGEVVSAEQMEQNIAEARAQYVQQQLDDASGKVKMEVGQTVTVPGTDVSGTVVAVSEDGEGATVQTEDGAQVPVMLQDVQNEADEQAMADYEERHANEAEQQPEGEASGTVVEQPSDDEMPMMEDGEANFLATTPERGRRYIYDEAGLTSDEAGAFVAANISEAEKALKKLQGKAPKMGTSIQKYQHEKESHQQQLDQAQQVVDYWNGVKAEQQKILAEEMRRRAEQDNAAREAAIIAEQQRQVEELAKREAQAQLGSNAVASQIKEKWDVSPKIEGNENEITLPGGEKVKGRYVLVESGAATPSHNPNMEFARNEGFPVDENGQTVNDRDYERDKNAQQITRDMADRYDSRAVQNVPVVSQDGVVLSGNGRTMAGELAAQNGTDGAYVEHLRKYPQQFGFTPEQVGTMQHPRVVFVPDEAMPYTTDTFAKFNAQDMKSQSRTEQSVKLGKTVDDATFGRIVSSINGFDTLGDFYNDPKAAIAAIGELNKAGVINQMQMAEMMDGEKISGIGRQMLENMLIGKAFESNPDAVRQLSEYPSMRQSVVSALAEVANNIKLGEEYSLESEMAQAIDLAYQARKSGTVGAGEKVSAFARQGNLFAFDEGDTVADYTNATVMMLADCINDNRVNQLKKVLSLYNDKASDSAAGQYDLFSGAVKSKEQIINEVLNILNYGTEQEQKAALEGATERRKGQSVQENGTDVTGNAGSGTADTWKGDLAQTEVYYQVSDEVDENGRPFVLSSKGFVEFGNIGEDTGLTPAPILLSEGMITNPNTKDGYGLVHIEAKHGEQIRSAGYKSVIDFIEEVGNNYEIIREGKNRNGEQTYLLQLTDKHDNTLMVELSGDGTYYNINTAGIFKHSYGAKKNIVYNRHTTEGQSAETDGLSQDLEQNGTPKSSRMVKPTTNSDGKDTKISGTEQEKVSQLFDIKDSPMPEGMTERHRGRMFSDMVDAYRKSVMENPIRVFGYTTEEQYAQEFEDFKNAYKSIVGEITYNDDERFLQAYFDYFNKKTSEAVEKKNVQDAIASAEAEVDTDPTEGQKKAGNYKMGHVTVDEEKEKKYAEMDAVVELAGDVAEAEEAEDEEEEMQIVDEEDSTLRNDTEAKKMATEAVMTALRGNAGLEVVMETQAAGRRMAERGHKTAEMMAVEKNVDNGIDALEKIAAGAESVQNAMRREDLSQYGGDDNITFYYGTTGDSNRNYKGGYGIAHIGAKHGTEAIAKAIQIIATGSVERYVKGNKTIILTDGEYEVVLALTRFGEKETWLFNGWKKIEKAGENGEVSTATVPTQTNPTFSREDLGAAISAAKILNNFDNPQVFEEEKSQGAEMLRPGGVVYGWAEGNRIHLTPEGINPNTPIHEYTHLWAKAVKSKNPRLWESIVALLKGTPEWEKVANDKNYTGLTTDDAIASETLARISGRENAKRMEAEAQKMIDEADGVFEKANAYALLGRMREALNRFWSWVGKNLFGIERFGSIEEVTDRVLYDLVNKTDLQFDGQEGGAEYSKSAMGLRINERDRYSQKEYLLSESYASRLTGKEFEKDDKPLTEKVTKFYNDNYGGKVVREGVGTVLLDERSVKDSIAHGVGRNKSIAFAAVPDIIEKGAIIDRHSNWKGRGYGSVTFAAPVKIGEAGFVGIVVANEVSMSDGSHRFYLHEVVLQKNLQSEEFKTGMNTGSQLGEIAKVMREISLAEKTDNDNDSTFRSKSTKNFGNDKKNVSNDVAYRDVEERKRAGVTYEEGLKNAKRAGYTRAQYDAYIERTERNARKRIADMIAKLNLTDKVEVREDASGLEGRKENAKGWYDIESNKIAIVLDNHSSVDDIIMTILHEGIGHYGLRQLFGKRFDTFLDNVFENGDDKVRYEIVELSKKHGWNVRTATEEYLARLAEDKNYFYGTKQDLEWWGRIKVLFIEMLHKIGVKVQNLGDKLSDNELRYILWRSYQNLINPGRFRSLVDEAVDIAKQAELKVGEFEEKKEKPLQSRKWFEEVPIASEETAASVDEAFNAQIDRLLSGEMNSNEYITLGMPMGVLSNYMPNDRIILRQKVVTKAYKKHGISAESIKNLPSAIANPIFIFKSSDNTISVLTEIKSKDGNNVFVSIELGVEKQMGHKFLEVNDILTIHGRNVENIIKPIIENESLVYVNKEKAHLWLSSVQPNGQAVTNEELNSVAKILKNFESDKYADNVMYRDGEEEIAEGSVFDMERITDIAAKMATRHKEDVKLQNNAMQRIIDNLSNLRKVISLQKDVDKGTVKRVTDLANVFINNGLIDEMSAYEVKRLLSAVKNSVGNEDVKENLNKVMDIMINNQLKRAEDNLHRLESVRGSKVDARGVEVQGELDIAGQRMVDAFKKGRRMQKEDLEERMTGALNRMGSDDSLEAEEAATEYAGLQMAIDYIDKIQISIDSEEELKKEMRDEEKKIYTFDSVAERDDEGNVIMKKDGSGPRMRTVRHTKPEFKAPMSEANKQLKKQVLETVEAIDDAIRKGRAERVQEYTDLVGRLSGAMRKSMENALAFKEAERERVRKIQHNANSDMEGRPSKEHSAKAETFLKRLNNGAGNTVFASLGTFVEMLRMFGSKSANGEGYLFNRFARGLIDSRQKEIRGVRDKYKQLDEKAREVFGGDVKRWADVMKEAGKGEKINVGFWDGGQMEDHELHQGNLMYIYMVNKMTDGRMKLRKMGVTEDIVEYVTEKLDPRMKTLADWIQDEFLPQSRKEYNETHKRMFGAPMASVENYFPLKILANARTDKPEDLDAPEMNDVISTKTGSVIKRKTNTLALDLMGADALHVILDHVAEMEHWNSFAEYNRDLNTLRTYKHFRNQVQNMTSIYGNGKELWNKFNELCQIAVGSYRPKQHKLDKGALEFAQGVTASKVSFRINTALKQFLSLPAYLPYINVRGFASSIASNIRNKEASFKWCMENLPMFEERWMSRVSGDPRLAKVAMDWKSGRANFVQNVARVGMLPNAFVDALTVSIGAHAVYETRLDQYIKEGYSREVAERRAIQDAEIAYNETQQSSEGGFVSTVQVDRTWLSVMFTIFRNASMAYQRQLHGALRNIWNNRTKAKREQTIEFETKQLVRDGIDENVAKEVAKERFGKQMTKNVLATATFSFIVQLAWNLGGYMWYLLFGDDDDEKDAIWEDIFAHTLFGPFEGLVGGDVISELGRQILVGDFNPKSLDKDMPLSSDLMRIGEYIGRGDNAAALNDIINIIVSAGIGMNPQSITDAVLASFDICGGDMALTHEAVIYVSRVLQVPQSQVEKLYFDEIDLIGKDVSKYTFEQLIERYAQYKTKRGYLYTPWLWDDDEIIKKKADYMGKTVIKERTGMTMKQHEAYDKKRHQDIPAPNKDKDIDDAYNKIADVYEELKKSDFEDKYKIIAFYRNSYEDAIKRDYVEAAQIMAELHSEEAKFHKENPDLVNFEGYAGLEDAEDRRWNTYLLFKSIEKNLKKIDKRYRAEETPEDERKVLAELIQVYKKGMVSILNAQTDDELKREQDKLNNEIAAYQNKMRTM